MGVTQGGDSRPASKFTSETSWLGVGAAELEELLSRPALVLPQHLQRAGLCFSQKERGSCPPWA